MFLPLSFWYALAADLWEEVSCRHEIKFNCLELGSVIQRPNEGVFELILEKEKAVKQILRGLSTVFQCPGVSLQQPW